MSSWFVLVVVVVVAVWRVVENSDGCDSLDWMGWFGHILGLSLKLLCPLWMLVVHSMLLLLLASKTMTLLLLWRPVPIPCWMVRMRSTTNESHGWIWFFSMPWFLGLSFFLLPSKEPFCCLPTKYQNWCDWIAFALRGETSVVIVGREIIFFCLFLPLSLSPRVNLFLFLPILLFSLSY